MPPEIITNEPAVTVPMPAATAATEELVSMVTGKLRRERGRAVLTLDVSKLHEYLEWIGVTKDTQYKRFQNAPASRSDIVDNVNHVLVPKALCSFDYKEGSPGVLEIDLLRHYTMPPTEDTLRVIAESVKDASVAVIMHYQPVEISISVVGKKPR